MLKIRDATFFAHVYMRKNLHFRFPLSLTSLTDTHTPAHPPTTCNTSSNPHTHTSVEFKNFRWAGVAECEARMIQILRQFDGGSFFQNRPDNGCAIIYCAFPDDCDTVVKHLRRKFLASGPCVKKLHLCSDNARCDVMCA